MRKLLILLSLLIVGMIVNAQDRIETDTIIEVRREKFKSAWEIGIGGSALQFNRVNIANYMFSTAGSSVDLELKHVVYGGNIYLAKELSRAFALDFQGTLGFGKSHGNDNKILLHTGLGLQWRLGNYFRSTYIDPYLRVGANYMYKGFDIFYSGSDGGMSWEMENRLNSASRDKTHMFPVTTGLGVNMWLNDQFGLGFQGDYLWMIGSGIANSLQGTVRVIWRLGGSSKKQTTYVNMHNKVTKFKEVEKIVEVEKVVTTEHRITTLLSGVHFDFDQWEIKPEYLPIIEKAADMLKADTNLRYLITGYTDSRGSARYNQELSEKRTRAIVDALIEKGVPRYMLKYRGVGKKVAHMDESASDKIREGDRKITIEIISNMDYWDNL